MTDPHPNNDLGADHNTLAEAFDLDDIEIDDDTDTVLFDGDTGSLPDRKKGAGAADEAQPGHLDHTPRERQTILDYIDGIRSRLNDLLPELVIDKANEVAYKRQAGQDLGRTFTTLLANRAYARDEVALRLHLRGLPRS